MKLASCLLFSIALIAPLVSALPASPNKQTSLGNLDPVDENFPGNEPADQMDAQVQDLPEENMGLEGAANDDFEDLSTPPSTPPHEPYNPWRNEIGGVPRAPRRPRVLMEADDTLDNRRNTPPTPFDHTTNPDLNRHDEATRRAFGPKALFPTGASNFDKNHFFHNKMESPFSLTGVNRYRGSDFSYTGPAGNDGAGPSNAGQNVQSSSNGRNSGPFGTGSSHSPVSRNLEDSNAEDSDNHPTSLLDSSSDMDSPSKSSSTPK